MYRLLIVSAFVLLLSGCGTLGGVAPVYGCWCGKGQPAPDENPTPVDAWDAACRNHDLCYRRYGDNNRHCDAGFLGELQSIALSTGYMPGQMQGAYSYFWSRLHGFTNIQLWMTTHDIATYAEAGSDYLCDY